MVMITKKPTAAVPDPRVALAVAGDRAVAQELLLELLPRVRNLVRYLVWSDADVDDIAQLALVEITRSFGNYRGEGALSSWADRITMRVTLHHIRRKRTEERRRSALTPDLRVVGGNDQPDDFTLRREAARLLDELPDDQRQAVVLHHVLGLSMPELAAELGIPFETARSRLRLGIQKLRARVFRRGAP